MRQRRVDRAILAESSSDPIDSEDQKLIILQFSADNTGLFRMQLRLLIVWIVAQMPLVTMVAKPWLRANQIALLIVANVLVLITGVFELPGRREGLSGGDFGGTRTLWVPFMVSFQGVSLLMGLVLLQLLVSLRGKALLFLCVPLSNLGLMVWFRKSYRDMLREIADLDRLRYKFKSA